MKFQQVKIGQKFEYQGHIYVKNSPLVANLTETGEQKLIPRYAVVTIINPPPSKQMQQRELGPHFNQVQASFNRFYASISGALEIARSEIETSTFKIINDKLEVARQQFFDELGELDSD